MPRAVGQVLALAVLAAACRAARPAPAPLDVEPSASLTPERVAAGGPVSVCCSFRVGSLAPPVTGAYRVFLHLVDREGALLLADDYRPSPPVDEWLPGHSYVQRRIVLTPEFPYAGEVRVLMGLYSETGGERLALRGEEGGRRAYLAGRFRLLPRERDLALDCPQLHESEATAAAPLVVTRFMGKAASCRFDNPREDVVLFLNADIEPHGFAEAPRLAIEGRGGRRLELPLALSDEPQLLRVRLSASALGRLEDATLRLAMSAFYVPRALGVNDDPRELSLRIRAAKLLRVSRVDPVLLEGAAELGRPQ